MPLPVEERWKPMTDAHQTQSYTLVNTPDQLAELTPQWLQCDVLGVDTEFVRTRTFYPNLGLIQLYDGEQIYLIDCVAIEDLSAFGPVLESQDVVKIFHAPGEDLEVLYHRLGAVSQSLFDLQLAAALAGFEHSLSLQALVLKLLHVDLPKGLSRSDWMARPLPAEQLQYAADDVIYLIAAYDLLKAKLDEKNRTHWVFEEVARQQQNVVNTEQDWQDYYKKIGAAALLSRHKLTVLKALCDWREGQARNLNVPRNRLISDKTLLEIAQRLPVKLEQLRKVPELHPQAVKKYGQILLGMIEENRDLPPQQCPERLPKPLSRELAKRLKALKSAVASFAEQQQLAPSVVLKKADYNAIMNNQSSDGLYTWPETIAPWRSALVKDFVLEHLNKETADLV